MSAVAYTPPPIPNAGTLVVLATCVTSAITKIAASPSVPASANKAGELRAIVSKMFNVCATNLQVIPLHRWEAYLAHWVATTHADFAQSSAYASIFASNLLVDIVNHCPQCLNSVPIASLTLACESLATLTLEVEALANQA